ncbi:hypothetical protein WJX73_007050 [Symbiochloris irregularis]|uniref:Uncharacterized protein n=1 Tax=Symbiochloris irregularis TaxID=706552 RepID=A0AAW1NW16_9CHLO
MEPLAPPAGRPARLSDSRFLPVTRWLDARKTGLSGLSIRLFCCSDSPSDCRHLHRYLADFLGSLHSLRINIQLNFSCVGCEHMFMAGPSHQDDPGSERHLMRDAIAHMTKLRHLTLRLSDCDVRGHDLHRLTALTKIGMSENDPGLGRVLTLPSTLVNLQELDLAINDLERLPGNLSSLNKLTWLDMSHMSLPNGYVQNDAAGDDQDGQPCSSDPGLQFDETLLDLVGMPSLQRFSLVQGADHKYSERSVYYLSSTRKALLAIGRHGVLDYSDWADWE